MKFRQQTDLEWVSLIQMITKPITSSSIIDIKYPVTNPLTHVKFNFGIGSPFSDIPTNTIQEYINKIVIRLLELSSFDGNIVTFDFPTLRILQTANSFFNHKRRILPMQSGFSIDYNMINIFYLLDCDVNSFTERLYLKSDFVEGSAVTTDSFILDYYRCNSKIRNMHYGLINSTTSGLYLSCADETMITNNDCDNCFEYFGTNSNHDIIGIYIIQTNSCFEIYFPDLTPKSLIDFGEYINLDYNSEFTENFRTIYLIDDLTQINQFSEQLYRIKNYFFLKFAPKINFLNAKFYSRTYILKFPNNNVNINFESYFPIEIEAKFVIMYKNDNKIQIESKKMNLIRNKYPFVIFQIGNIIN